MSILFFYGRVPELSRLEARSVYSQAGFISLTDSIDYVEGIEADAESIVSRLGGTVKIGNELVLVESISDELLYKSIASCIKKSGASRFLLSAISFSLPQTYTLQLKKRLKQDGIAVRFSVPSHEHTGSAAQIRQKDTVEFTLVSIKGMIALVQTIAVQDPDEWTKRDMGRPAIDARRGMLPMKMARIVANIALKDTPDTKVCVDPFCGMGTIISEGLTIGGAWYGCDIEQKAADGTKKNIEWLASQYKIPGVCKEIRVCDAVHLSSWLSPQSVDVIVTEPYLGDPSIGLGMRLDPKHIRNVLKGLEKLYIGCLKDWRGVLKAQGYVIIAFPSVVLQKHKETVKKVIDSCENLGYSIEAGPYVYGRPNAVVERNFFVLKKL